MMKRFMTLLLTLAFVAANDAASWASNLKAVCPGKCPFCP